MTQEVGLLQVFSSIEEAFKASDLKRVEALLWPAVDQFPAESRLWFYAGCVKFKAGQVALAAACFHRAIDLDDAPHIYSNLGACYRRMNMHEQGLRVLHSCLERQPDYAPALVNLGSMYVNEGNPSAGIPYLEKAVEIGTERGAHWNLGLLYLESCRFGEGFDLYREGITHERALRSYGSVDQTLPEPKLLSPEDVVRARVNEDKPTLIVWGEQGIGDELMFGTAIEDARKDFNVIFECHPRLQRLHRNAHPGMPLYPTRKEEFISWPVTENIRAEYKCGIADLGCHYRRDLKVFSDAWEKRGPTYQANPSETMLYRTQLEALADGRPIIALATRGGVLTTARQYRTIRAPELDRLIGETDALFVGVDYDDMLSTSLHISEKHGEDRYRWFPAIVQHWDYDHTAALINACDMTVTVCQSVAHLSAGMGLPTRVLTPIRCAWRYAVVPGDPEVWYWYPDSNIKLYRQDDPETWDHPLTKVISDINALKPRAEVIDLPKTAVLSPAPMRMGFKGVGMGRRK